MTTIAIRYTYVDDAARLDEHRPEHRAFLRSLHESGDLLLCGPFADEPAGALLVLTADDADAALALLDADPFRREGLITEREARSWNVVIGEL